MGIRLQCSGHMVLAIFAVGIRQSLLGSDWKDCSRCGVGGTRIPHLGGGVLLGECFALGRHAQYSLGNMMTQRSLSQTA